MNWGKEAVITLRDNITNEVVLASTIEVNELRQMRTFSFTFFFSIYFSLFFYFALVIIMLQRRPLRFQNKWMILSYMSCCHSFCLHKIFFSFFVFAFRLLSLLLVRYNSVFCSVPFSGHKCKHRFNDDDITIDALTKKKKYQPKTIHIPFLYGFGIFDSISCLMALNKKYYNTNKVLPECRCP